MTNINCRIFKGHACEIHVIDDFIEIRQFLLKETCKIENLVYVKITQPAFLQDGMLTIKTPKNEFQLAFKNKQNDEFNTLYVFLNDKIGLLNVSGNTKYEQLGSLIIENCGIKLLKDEVCFYKGNAKSYHSRKGVVGYTGGGSGVSVRVAKGLSVYTGGSNKKSIRDNIVDTYPAILYITNQRVVLNAEKYGFNIKLEKLDNYKPYLDAIDFNTNGKCHRCLTNEAKKINNLFILMDEVFKEIENKHAESNDPYEEIKKLKELLDMDIITNEEFEIKKKELLNL